MGSAHWHCKVKSVELYTIFQRRGNNVMAKIWVVGTRSFFFVEIEKKLNLLLG